MKPMAWHGILFGSIFTVLFGVWPAQADTLDLVRQRGGLICGVAESNYGFAARDKDGQWLGFEVDFCRAIAAAVLGSRDRVAFVPLSATTRFAALQRGDVDVLIRTTTHTLSRDAEMAFQFAPVIYYDGQGFLAPKSLGVTKLADLKQARVCVSAETTTYQNLLDLRKKDLPELQIQTYKSWDGQYTAFFTNQCDLITDDKSSLMGLLQAVAPEPQDYVMLEDVISKEPLSPVVREDSPAWSDIVNWVVYAVIGAEEYGLSSANIKQHLAAPESAEVARLLGLEGELGAALGLEADWAKRIIEQVGNYGEIFERNLGAGSLFKTPRGLNDQWTRGGLLYAPPFK
ncbi:amino acid ABC transporter substrate-binding protein [Magnetospira thiophila]